MPINKVHKRKSGQIPKFEPKGQGSITREGYW